MIEYILLVTAVVAVMIVFATTKNSGMQGYLCSTLNTAVGDIGTSMTALTQSHAAVTAQGGAEENIYTINVSPN